ncbi:MAG: DNA topoisomerase IB [Aurantimonas endophytica]|uniref:DNA topoisomerase n=1 Tax=Aurantimonas endophytica TaxID=1522175 RepID=A0A7W6HD10_9HYPH|nr:DNA topoisomerase IB [Aurantimonas endophytica]MBB4002873.1 DNA topoisomerase-1 [Aurantimonas endophytica]MCO6403750.1 DNA topoisomerase IB [Aurantimonas endophytica]
MNLKLAQHAERFGLTMVDPELFAIERRRSGKGHKVCFSSGEKVIDKRLKARIKALVIPPAWTNVRICVEENGHIQAIGRDEKGRLQYRYHDDWVNVRNAVKTERLLRFGRALPRLRRRIAKDLRRRTVDRLSTSAVATRLIDVAAMRPGHEKYAEDGGRGVASLRKQNLRIVKKVAVLKFVGKSNKENRIEIADKALVRSLQRVREGKGQRLFRFPDAKKKQRELTANLLNEYLREAAQARISAKDFRTFHGSAEALRYLIEETEGADTDSKRKRAVAKAMRSVSQVLRNTPAVARSSYVHPEIVEAFEAERLPKDLLKGRQREGLTRVETGLMRFLEEVARQAE